MGELMFYQFEVGHNAMESTKEIRFIKDKGAVDLVIVTRWFKKFYSGCKNLENYARSESLDSKAE